MLYRCTTNFLRLKQIKFDKVKNHFQFVPENDNQNKNNKLYNLKNKIFLCLQKEIIYNKHVAIKVLYENKVGWVHEYEFEKI